MIREIANGILGDIVSDISGAAVVAKAVNALPVDEREAAIAFLLEQGRAPAGPAGAGGEEWVRVGDIRNAARMALPHLVPSSPAHGPLKTIPVRFPEGLYDRLKAWSEANGFPMAVVIRGLVERFLDERA